VIGDVRGVGAMLAIEIVKDPATKEPDADTASAIVEAAAERGLLLLKAGIYANCIRVLSSLLLNDAELDEALTVWEEALEATLG
jgi:4-aminobutyrate aminotransferase/(S)-3-amino-2-methylpropionate transaminase